MTQFDKVLKMYAETGLRTVEDWISVGRDLAVPAKPRLEVRSRGDLIPLYSRDQTQTRPRARMTRQP